MGLRLLLFRFPLVDRLHGPHSQAGAGAVLLGAEQDEEPCPRRHGSSRAFKLPSGVRSHRRQGPGEPPVPAAG